MLIPNLGKEKFEPDYSWTTEKLFFHFAKYVLKNFGFSDRAALLSFAGLSRRQKAEQNTPMDLAALPSWVPDWRAHNSTRAAVFSILREGPFNASKGTPLIMYALGEYGTDECFITQIGYSLGKIASLSQTVEELGANLSQEPVTASAHGTARLAAALRLVDRQWLQWYTNAAQLLSTAVIEGALHRYQDPPDAFARTLLAGDDYKGANATPTSVPIENPSACLAAVVADTASDHPKIGLGTRTPDGVYKSQAHVACRDRRFAVTDHGYMGLVPTCSQIGDEVYLLGGVTVPVVLRHKHEVKFVLVGDSYIEGVMEGEVAQTLTESDWRPTFIC